MYKKRDRKGSLKNTPGRSGTLKRRVNIQNVWRKFIHF
jgi:hypothetical protein